VTKNGLLAAGSKRRRSAARKSPLSYHPAATWRSCLRPRHSLPPTSSSSVSRSRTTPPSTPLLTTGCLSSRTCARTLQPCLLDASQICAHPQDFSDLCPPSTGSPYLGKPAPPSTLRPPPSPTTPAAPTLLLRWPVLPLLATSQGLHLRRDLSPEGEQGGERQASQGVREVARA